MINFSKKTALCIEEKRLYEDSLRKANWKRWGPYLSERQWGTVREDYSSNSDSWGYFTHDQARSKAYRWGEDGILGFTDRECRLCFGLSFWNGKDSILKERLFGLSNPEGNHGEDVKELYYYLDSSPTHSYFKGLYKYPQNKYPYDEIVGENSNRNLKEREYEIEDTGVFADNAYFDVFVEYAKQSPDDILIKVTIQNCSKESAYLDFLPTLWFRNTWIWGCKHEGCTLKPLIKKESENHAVLEHQTLNNFNFYFENSKESLKGDLIFTENETNTQLLYEHDNYTPYVKDAFHRYIVDKEQDAICSEGKGTKLAVHYNHTFAPQEKKVFKMRLFSKEERPKVIFGKSFDDIFEKRIKETNDFYKKIIPKNLTNEEKNVQRQSYAGLLWSKQFYHYSVYDWLKGDKNTIAPPEKRKKGRNHTWEHLFMRNIISMPDKWEYPWFAAWDLAFHMIPFAAVDPVFSKEQLILFLREWVMNPNGQLPAYEYTFDDVNPPVHAWACWRVYKMTGLKGDRDIKFLSETFHKLLINFTWWVNKKDPDGRNLFSGGFLGLDNIGPFDRSKNLPVNGRLIQADGTSWMAFYCSTMLSIAMEIADQRPEYDGVASKFFEHFMAITDAINHLGNTGLWDEEDGFYYDLIDYNDHTESIKVRSMVGLIPLFAVEVLDERIINNLEGFAKRLKWFLKNRKDLSKQISFMEHCSDGSNKLLLAVPSKDRLRRVLRYVLDEDEFLSPYGIRSLSKYHEKHPYVFRSECKDTVVSYVPGESESRLFGGNSNWRGPIWFPLNFLLIEALEKYHYFYGDDFTIECPTGSGNFVTLDKVAKEIGVRLSRLFLKNKEGAVPSMGEWCEQNKDNPHFKDLVLFYEYFDGNTGRGLGASHQTGWTALIAKILEDLGKSR